MPISIFRPGFITGRKNRHKPTWPFAVNKDSLLYDGLQNWWPFSHAGDEDVLWDIVGDNNGTFTNDPPWTSNINTGEWGLDFNGSNQYVACPGTIDTAGAITVCFWNYVLSGDVQGSSAFGGYGSVANDDRLQAHAPWSDNTLYFDYGNQTTGRISTSYAAFDDKWTRVVLTSEGGGGSFKGIYFDGELQASGGSSDGPTGNVTIDIGRADLDNAGIFYHNAQIDDFRIYNRRLSATEIAYDYEYSNELCYPIGQRTFLIPSTVAGPTLLSIAGSLTFSAPVTQQIQSTTTGTLTTAGAVTQQVQKLFAGALSFVGAVTHQVQTVLTGAYTSAGALSHEVQKLFSGALTFVGTVVNVQVATVALSGALTFVGALTNQVQKLFAGTLTTAGALTKQVQKLFTGALTFVGTVVNILVATVSNTGALTFVGTLTNQVQKLLSGSLTFVGALTHQTSKAFTASLSFVGAVTHQAQKTFSGALTFVGTVASEIVAFTVNLAGALTFTGTIQQRLSRLLTATLTFVGTVVHLLPRLYTGALTFVGTVASVVVSFVPLPGFLVRLFGQTDEPVHLDGQSDEAVRLDSPSDE